MLPYTIGANDTITIHMGTQTRAVRSDHPNYDDVLRALQDKRWDDIPDLIDRSRVVEKASGGQLKVHNGQVYCKDFDGEEFAVPSGLNKEILKYQRLGLDYDRLILFAQRLQENPSYRSVNQLFQWIHKAGLTVTEEGKFIAYRGVMKVTNFNRGNLPEEVRDATYVDWYSKSFDNSLGTVVKMKRNQVDEDPGSSCSRGLHVATYSYAHNFYNSGAGGDDSTGEVLYVEVCPSHVVAVPNGEPDKMRVCEFIPLGISDGPIQDPHYEEATTDTDPMLEAPEDDVPEVYVDALPAMPPTPGQLPTLNDDEDEEEDEDDWDDEDY